MKLKYYSVTFWIILLFTLHIIPANAQRAPISFQVSPVYEVIVVGSNPTYKITVNNDSPSLTAQISSLEIKTNFSECSFIHGPITILPGASFNLYCTLQAQPLNTTPPNPGIKQFWDAGVCIDSGNPPRLLGQFLFTLEFTDGTRSTQEANYPPVCTTNVNVEKQLGPTQPSIVNGSGQPLTTNYSLQYSVIIRNLFEYSGFPYNPPINPEIRQDLRLIDPLANNCSARVSNLIYGSPRTRNCITTTTFITNNNPICFTNEISTTVSYEVANTTHTGTRTIQFSQLKVPVTVDPSTQLFVIADPVRSQQICLAHITIDKIPTQQTIVSGDKALFQLRLSNTGSADLALSSLIDTIAPNCESAFNQFRSTTPILSRGNSVVVNCEVDNVTADFVNAATVSASYDTSGGVVSAASGNAQVVVLNPSLTIKKSANKAIILNGDTVTYTYEVTNTGTAQLGTDLLTDSQSNLVNQRTHLSDNRCNVDNTAFTSSGNTDPLLDPNETWIFSCTNNVTPANATNDAEFCATYKLINKNEVKFICATTSVTVDVVLPAVNIQKSSDTEYVRSNTPTTVNFTYLVTNRGNVPLSRATISDDKCAPVTFSNGDTNANGAHDIGEVWTYTCSKAITTTTDEVNEACVSNATYEVADPLITGGILTFIAPTACETATVKVAVSDIMIIVRPANQRGFEINGTNDEFTADFAVQVINTGNVPLTNVTIVSLFGVCSFRNIGTLTAGQNTTRNCWVMIKGSSNPDVGCIVDFSASGEDIFGITIIRQNYGQVRFKDEVGLPITYQGSCVLT